MSKFGFLAILTRFLSEKGRAQQNSPLGSSLIRNVGNICKKNCCEVALRFRHVRYPLLGDLIIQLEVNKKYIKKYDNNRTKIVFANEP